MIGDWQARLSVIVPAYNEVAGIARTLGELRRAIPDAEIIVVDDGSTDNTAEIASTCPGVRILRHAFNAGYGAALKTGMQAATREYLAWFDADNQHGVDDLVGMVERLHKDRLVAVIGTRRPQYAMQVRSVGKWVIWMLAWVLKIQGVGDLNCGLRVFRRRWILRYVSLLPDGFSASLTTTTIMLERRYPIAFHPVTARPRLGQSKVRLVDGFAALALVLRMIMLFAPLRIFLRAGLLLAIAGATYGLAMALTRFQGIPAGAVLVTATGFMLCVLGLIADQLSQMRLERLGGTAIIDDE